MSRLTYAKRHPRRVLGALTSVVVAAGVAIGSGADFSAHTANASNTFAAGSMHIGNSPSGAILTLTGLRPGDRNGGTVDITNDGSIGASQVTLTRTNLVDKDGTTGHAVCGGGNVCASPLSQKLDLVVYDCGDFTTSASACPTDATIVAANPGTDANVEYSGTLAAFSTPKQLGALAKDHSHRYRFVSTFNSTATAAYQNEQSQADFEWDAAQ